MKKTAFALILFLMLFILVFAFQDVKVVKALDISFPSHSTYSTGSPLALSVSSDGLGASNIHYSMTYSIDGQGNVSIPLVTHWPDFLSFQVEVTGSSIMPELPEGPHNVTVYEEIHWDAIPPHTFLDNATSYFTIDDGNFTIDDGKPPIITILSSENKTYSQNTLSLNFTTNKHTSWIGYSLDGKNNITITDNSTITNLTNGFHNITVYGKDTYGIIGNSQAMNFSVDVPAPTPTTATETNSTSIVAILIVAVIANCSGLLVYFGKRNNRAIQET